MANGAYARLPSALDVASDPTRPVISLEVEAEIAEAVAAAATVLSAALFEYLDGGGLSPKIKDAGGRRIARVFELSQSFGAGFDVVARRAGGRILRGYFDSDTDFQARHGAQAAEVVIEDVIGQILAIVARVQAFEAAHAY